jgi:sigma-B regulation protein RsbU (phosphoserine phosphatase)
LAHAQRVRLERELEMARVVQASLLPGRMPAIPGFDLAADWRAATDVAGAFYDIFPLAGDRWGLVVADVAGKGAPAALCMAMVQSLIRATVQHTPEPAEALIQVNRTLTAQSSATMFVTVFYAVLDPPNQTLTYTNAGHNWPIVRRTNPSTPIEQLHSEGLPLGLFEETELADTTISLLPGDLLVAYTDGLTEAFDAKGEMYGSERLIQLVNGLPMASARQVVDTIMSETTAFAGQVPQSDDITLLALRCQPR